MNIEEAQNILQRMRDRYPVNASQCDQALGFVQGWAARGEKDVAAIKEDCPKHGCQNCGPIIELILKLTPEEA